MKGIAGPPRNIRAASLLVVFAVHVALGVLLSIGARTASVPPDDALSVFDVPMPPASPPVAEADRAADPRDEGAAAPPALEAAPVPVVAPPARLPRPSPVTVAPAAGEGREAAAGAAPVPGPGTGGGGEGAGTGSGLGGDGQGGGGGMRAEKRSGVIVDRDYPRASRRAREEGSVTVRFTVDEGGRVRDCAVAQSSGHGSLDAATCRLIEARFRYRPARDAAGRPVAETRGWRQDWWLEPRQGAGTAQEDRSGEDAR